MNAIIHTNIHILYSHICVCACLYVFIRNMCVYPTNVLTYFNFKSFQLWLHVRMLERKAKRKDNY